MKFDVPIINEWLKMNKLKLNESKTKVIEINVNSDRVFEINDRENRKSWEYLGFIIVKKLGKNWLENWFLEKN